LQSVEFVSFLGARASPELGARASRPLFPPPETELGRASPPGAPQGIALGRQARRAGLGLERLRGVRIALRLETDCHDLQACFAFAFRVSLQSDRITDFFAKSAAQKSFKNAIRLPRDTLVVGKGDAEAVILTDRQGAEESVGTRGHQPRQCHSIPLRRNANQLARRSGFREAPWWLAEGTRRRSF
jgi:hypothetical protein